MTTLRLTLHGDRERNRAREAIASAPPLARVEIAPPKRSDPQNRAMWAKLHDILAQRGDWFGPGLDEDDLKQVFMSALAGELRMARSADGRGFVPLGRRSSKLSHAMMGELLTLMDAWGADPDHIVRWTDRADNIRALEAA